MQEVVAPDEVVVPAGHAAQTLAPAAEYSPVAQVAQLDDEIAPDDDENVPAGQAAQAVALARYLPAGHAAHDDAPFAAYVPDGQLEQVAESDDPEADR